HSPTAASACSTSAGVRPGSPSPRSREKSSGPGRRRIDPRDIEPATDERVSTARTGAGTTAPGRFAVKRRSTAIAALLVAAAYAEGRPIIGLLGEYDALPGLSQKARPAEEALTPGAPGHGCGHNLLGAAALGAAVAVKEQIAAGRIRGTVRFYGCPAEETLV